LEDKKTCPQDCLVVEKPFMQQLIERSLLVLALLLVIFMVGGFVFVLYEHFTKKTESELPSGFNVSGQEGIPENRLHYLKGSISNLRIGLADVRKRRQLLKTSRIGEKERTKKEDALKIEESAIESRIREYEEMLKRHEKDGSSDKKIA
jgi:hypothetical protein